MNVNANTIVLAEQVLTWFITGALTFKENNAITAQFRPMFEQALAENRALTDEERAQLNAFAQAEHDAAEG